MYGHFEREKNFSFFISKKKGTMEKMIKFYKNKRILITGITGFKGSWLASMLLQLGSKVYGIGYNPNNNKRLFNNMENACIWEKAVYTNSSK